MSEYSGRVSYTYSTKIENTKDLKTTAKKLIKSGLCSFSLDTTGELTYLKDSRLKRDKLKITPNHTRNGMTISNHSRFIQSQTSDISKISFKIALDLFLSTYKLFNLDFGFPSKHIRAFLHPIFIKNAGNETYETFIPYVTIYENGYIQAVIYPLDGFSEPSSQKLIKNVVNRFQIKIDSILGCNALINEIFNQDYDNLGFFYRAYSPLITRKQKKEIFRKKFTVNFGDENIKLSELLHIPNQTFTINDFCLNLIDIFGNILSRRKRISPRYWLSSGRSKTFRSSVWIGKPNIYIESHPNQRESSRENLELNRTVIQNITTRTHSEEYIETDENRALDLRPFDDFNHIYAESSTVVILSSKTKEQLTQTGSFTFDNIVSDCQIKNDVALLISTIYESLIDELGRISSVQQLYEFRRETNTLEEKILRATRQLGEISNFFQTVREQTGLRNSRTHLEQKFLASEQLTNLREKIISESQNKKLTIAFGIIASVSISPEIIQPLAKFFDWHILYSDTWGKISSALAAFLIVFAIIKAPEALTTIKKSLKSRHKWR